MVANSKSWEPSCLTCRILPAQLLLTHVCGPHDIALIGRVMTTMMMMSFICPCRNKIGAELHIYLEEGTYHKRLFSGPSTKGFEFARGGEGLGKGGVSV
jgi:hypothetical protein